MRLLCIVAAFGFLAPGGALAQATPAQPESSSKPQASMVTPLTVKGRKPIDRRAYAIDTEVLRTHGSIADALREVPSVDVDPTGAVSLRGDSNVTILVDGLPSALFQGANKAESLRQLPAGQYERIEVITNPSATFRPEGSAGIINLVTRKGRATPSRASVHVGGDTLGGAQVSAMGELGLDRLSLSANAGFYRDSGSHQATTSRTITDPASGATAQVSVADSGRSRGDFWAAGAGARYELDPATHVEAQLSAYEGANRVDSSSRYRSSAVSGVLAQDYDSAGAARSRSQGYSGSATLRRELGGDDRELLATANYSDSSNRSDEAQAFAYSLPPGSLFQDLQSRSDSRSVDAKLDYKGPLPWGARLEAGYELEAKREADAHSGLLGATMEDAQPQPALFDHYRWAQTTHDLFATVEASLGRWQVMPGLRLEEAYVSIDDLSQRLTGRQSYFEAFPSLHLAYRLNDALQLKASYSRRIDRPNADALNPFRIYANPLSYSQGNPNLRPTLTDSYEVSAEYSRGAAYLLASLYYRDKEHAVSLVTLPLAGGAVLDTSENVGREADTGVELEADDRLLRTLALRLTLSAFRRELSGVPGGPPNSGTVSQVKVRLNWTPTSSDFLQLWSVVQGPAPTAQGSRSGYVILYLGYRRRLGDHWSAEATVRDPFDWIRITDTIDTPELKQGIQQRFGFRAATLGLTYALGGAKEKADKDFDFSAAPAH